MPVRNTPAKGYVKRSDGKYHKPYPKKGERRKGRMAGSRKAFDDTKDSKRSPDTASKRRKGVTTKKGMSRKGKVAGSRLAFDDTHQEWEKIQHHLGYQ
mgnify:CR=1 FL=1|tara:strand:- start:1552 stop:1845 length:294 start_codon:yes stop_codon:yes gene_type:complete